MSALVTKDKSDCPSARFKVRSREQTLEGKGVKKGMASFQELPLLDEVDLNRKNKKRY